MEFNDVFKIASIRTAIYNVNVRSEPRPTRPIPHFTPSTYTLLDQLRLNQPNPRIVDDVCITRLKEDGTYFTEEEWMREQEKDLFDIPLIEEM